ncbi:MAG: proline--tRNA ligase [Candidatus Diapherotrites archaeon]|nr:proline--tRNA ligase [Candidatus Diapherotrites archaeon]
METSRADFSDWYHSVLEEAEVIDSRYNLKGTYAWRPFGFKLRTLVFGELRRLMDETGHDETLFPLLIPEDQLMKEAKHIKGFEDGVYWVTKGGLSDLEVPLALRPTSETVMYPLFKLWIRSHADLPLKIYQIVNTFRYETKHTRPLIRDREISTFKEAHCAHPDQKGVDEEMELIRKAYDDFFAALCVPAVVVERPEWDRFPGAVKTVSWDVVMPDYKTLQSATSHDLGTGFSKTFEVMYENEKGEQQLCHLNSHGISSRIIAAVIGVHGDEHGLVLPPAFAPIQAVVVPVVFKGDKKKIESAAKKVFGSLSCRKEIDTSDDNPGAKYYRWELKGVPVRIEVGPRDVEKGEAVLVRRDTRQKKAVKLKDVDKEVAKLLAEITKSMKKKALEFHEQAIANAKSRDSLREADKAALPVLVPVCGDAKCWGKLEGSMKRLEFRGTVLGAKPSGKCIGCGKKAESIGLFSNAY